MFFVAFTQSFRFQSLSVSFSLFLWCTSFLHLGQFLSCAFSFILHPSTAAASSIRGKRNDIIHPQKSGSTGQGNILLKCVKKMNNEFIRCTLLYFRTSCDKISLNINSAYDLHQQSHNCFDVKSLKKRESDKMRHHQSFNKY